MLAPELGRILQRITRKAVSCTVNVTVACSMVLYMETHPVACFLPVAQSFLTRERLHFRARTCSGGVSCFAQCTDSELTFPIIVLAVRTEISSRQRCSSSGSPCVVPASWIRFPSSAIHCGDRI